MMETRAYRLRLHSPLHVGERGIGLETALPFLPSDTLFSALAVTWSRMPAHQAAVANLADAFRDQPPLLLTSAFPLAGDVPLLPRPALSLLPHPEDGQSVVKSYKRVRWVSLRVFQSLVSGLGQAQLDGLWSRRCLAQGGEVWLMADEANDVAGQLGGRAEELSFWQVAREPKVTVDRITNASAIFHVGRVHFAQHCGLWCMMHGAPDWLARAEAALALLADSGIGGKRSQGSGQFSLEAPVEAPAIGDPAGDHAVLLSRLSPRPDELPLLTRPGASYQLASVGGYNGTPGDAPLIRKQVRLLVEGSIIGRPAGTPGRLLDITPDGGPRPAHRIYRYGYGYAAPAQAAQEAAP